METHLTTIGSTLDAILRLHASAPSSSKNVYRPFTCAVLNTYKLDVLDYIRDADQVESNLFWYPPLPGTSSGNKAEAEWSEDNVVSAVTTRLPEPREFIPPTPLRKNVLEAEAKGLVHFDARTLLKAAQRLLANYHHAPRARKHVKALLKQNSELERQMSQQEVSLSRIETLIARLSHAESRKELVVSVSEKPHSLVNPNEEIRTLQESIKREQMEIFAIEQTTEDLLEKRQRKLTQKAKSQLGGKARTSVTRSTVSSSPRAGTLPPRVTISTKKSSSEMLDKSNTHVYSQRPEAAQMKASSQTSATDLKLTMGHDESDENDTTLQHPSSVAEYAQLDEESLNDTLALVQPESSDELERICENIWTLFGDAMRYVAVEQEGANYRDTLRILQDLSVGGASSKVGEGDVSMASSSNASQDTAATSGSTNSTSTQVENAGPPSSMTAIAARLLFTLLTSPPPHAMAFDDLTSVGVAWWAGEGCEALKKASEGREKPADIDDSSASLANKAVYNLMAKKLLRIQFRVGKRIVSFPAHIP
ncbi:hypothetical protein CBS101457_001099 [Exobasidium rhododendri]|nr:hypothetical protein CBS101457_001099 [Exobasidium rhododendri]